MAIRVGINGFGRIGRNILRAIAESGRNDIEVVAINDLAPVETNAHLLRFDSVHGRFPGEVTVKGDTISVGNGAIKVTAVKDPAELKWNDERWEAEEKAYVVRVMREGQVEERPVSVGLQTRMQAQVLSGLAAGEEVIVGSAANKTKSGQGKTSSGATRAL